MTHTTSSLSKPKPTLIKKGRVTLGAIYELPTGKVYLAYRRLGDIWRGTEKCISDAVRKSTACWAIEDSICLDMRAKGIAYIGVLVKDTGERYVAPTPAFFEYGAFRSVTVRGKGGSQRALPLQSFAYKQGKIVKTK